MSGYFRAVTTNMAVNIFSLCIAKIPSLIRDSTAVLELSGGCCTPWEPAPQDNLHPRGTCVQPHALLLREELWRLLNSLQQNDSVLINPQTA